jgi:hypothetical protein
MLVVSAEMPLGRETLGVGRRSVLAFGARSTSSSDVDVMPAEAARAQRAPGAAGGTVARHCPEVDPRGV